MRGLGVLTAICIAVLFSGHAAGAVTCERVTYDGNRYTLCTVEPAKQALELFLYAPDELPYGQFTRLEDTLAKDGKALLFAMNGGMYHEDRAPVGHYVENGREAMRVISRPGPGNFGLLPNGILCIRKNRADVIETRDFLATRPNCIHATQSGPMLVVEGELHPRFLPDSTSRYIRNGVGTSGNGRRAVFAISDNAVTFHEFARLFRDHLQMPNALFLDGNVSRLYAPQLGRRDAGRLMGPIVGVTAPLAN